MVAIADSQFLMLLDFALPPYLCIMNAASSFCCAFEFFFSPDRMRDLSYFVVVFLRYVSFHISLGLRMGHSWLPVLGWRTIQKERKEDYSVRFRLNCEGC